jgi:hypothetical protein
MSNLMSLELLLFYLIHLYIFRAFLAHHQEILYCLVSRYVKRKCGRELWCLVVSVVWSVFPWHCLSARDDTAMCSAHVMTLRCAVHMWWHCDVQCTCDDTVVCNAHVMTLWCANTKGCIFSLLLPYFLAYSAHLKYNAHPKLFCISFEVQITCTTFVTLCMYLCTDHLVICGQLENCTLTFFVSIGPER